jgi:hypothetical protein
MSDTLDAGGGGGGIGVDGGGGNGIAAPGIGAGGTAPGGPTGSPGRPVKADIAGGISGGPGFGPSPPGARRASL